MDSQPKRVRFVDALPQTPSPASSSTSLTSSPGPFTPPQLHYNTSPPTIIRPADYHPSPPRGMPTVFRMPSPQLSPALMPVVPEGTFVIDPLLLAPSHRAHPPPLRWDIAQHPDSIKLGSIGSPRARQLSHDDLASCAVRTSAHGSPLTLRRIMLVFPGLPLTVEIEPAGTPVWTSSPLPYLSVGDVLYGLYTALRLSLKPQEFDSLERPHRESATRAFNKRLNSDRENYDKNVRHGVRRIDLLGDMRMFDGLRPATGSEIPYGRRPGEVFVAVLSPAR